MTPHRQQLGNDCHRTCIAMVLDMDPDAVPHFCADVPPGDPNGTEVSNRAKHWENDWLLARGLVPVTVPFPGTEDLTTIVSQFGTLGTSLATILGCSTSDGVNHSVVTYDGKVYDPAGWRPYAMYRPMLDGLWWVTVFAAATTPLQSTPAPGTPETGQETH